MEYYFCYNSDFVLSYTHQTITLCLKSAILLFGSRLNFKMDISHDDELFKMFLRSRLLPCKAFLTYCDFCFYSYYCRERVYEFGLLF